MGEMKLEGKVSITSDHITIYYHPDDMNLPDMPDVVLLAKCIIMVNKYKPIGIMPERGVRPSEWLEIDAC